MLKIKENVDLSKLSTMRVGGIGKYFLELTSVNELAEITSFIKSKNINFIIIGEGSNTLFTGDYEGLIIKNCIKGIHIVERQNLFTKIVVGAGENWHKFVEYCVNNNLIGNENLAYIPGTVGAAPVQNIGAYGQVQEDTFVSLEAFDILDGTFRTFKKADCEFKYRHSVFKYPEYKSRYIITSVTYQLKTDSDFVPDLSYHSRYESLKPFLENLKKDRYDLKDVFNAIIQIRKHKLPDINDVGTLGSFFLNPFVDLKMLKKIQEIFPNIQFYPIDKMQYPQLDELKSNDLELVKLPAGWILEELGWKGKFNGNVGCSPKHALCIIVKGKATGQEVVDFSNEIIASTAQKTGIYLKPEVNFV